MREGEGDFAFQVVKDYGFKEFKRIILSSKSVDVPGNMLAVRRLADMLSKMSKTEIIDACNSGQLTKPQLNAMEYALRVKKSEIGEFPGLYEKIVSVIEQLI